MNRMDLYMTARETSVQKQNEDLIMSYIEEKHFTSICQQYMQYLFGRERKSAERLIKDTMNSGTSIKDVYLHIFQATQYEIGRLWQTNKISVAEEHYFTAATQLIMAQLYPYIFNSEKSDLKFLGTCIAGEQHELGIRMVCDLMEADGWDSLYLGANCPTSSIIDILTDFGPDVLGISATMIANIREVTNLIENIRGNKIFDDMAIIVGGYPFNLPEDLWKKVGADAVSIDCSGAVTTSRRLVNEKKNKC